jgi:adenylyl-sulfate kinase
VRSIQLDPLALGRLELFLRGALPAFPIHASEPLLLRDPHNVRIATCSPDGSIELIALPEHHDFLMLRRNPGDLPIHTGIVTDGFITREMETLLARHQPSVLHVLEFGAVDHFARVRAALAVLPPDRVNLLPLCAADAEQVELAVRAYGAREVLTVGGDSYSPAVQSIVDEAVPPRHKQGFCVFFTGLPSAGKSTIANLLAVLLRERGRVVSMLDGDVVRMHLSKGLGFSREDRDTNIRRIGFVAAEIVRHHGVAICAAVSPYQESRDAARAMVGRNFILVYVATPAEICEQRDVKGFYARARAGTLGAMTGVDDPYEPPTNAEITLHTTTSSPAENAQAVLDYLRTVGLVTL